MRHLTRTRKRHEEPQFATDSKVWRREHVIVSTAKPAVPDSNNEPIPATSRG